MYGRCLNDFGVVGGWFVIHKGRFVAIEVAPRGGLVSSTTTAARSEARSMAAASTRPPATRSRTSDTDRGRSTEAIAPSTKKGTV